MSDEYQSYYLMLYDRRAKFERNIERVDKEIKELIEGGKLTFDDALLQACDAIDAKYAPKDED